MDSLKGFELYIGLFAGICTAISLLPQLIKIIRDKKANAISYGMLGILMLGLITWIVYGIVRKDYLIILIICLSLILNIVIFIFIIKYKTGTT